MGKGIVDSLKREFNLKEEWVNFELHPETPPEGILKSKVFPGYPLDKMDENLNRLGAPYQIRFGKNELLSNSRKALEAGEFARAKGKFDEFHEKVFLAYFLEGKNIGDEMLLLSLAKDAGMDPEALKSAWQKGDYGPCLEKSKENWDKLQVTGIPTFVINGKDVLVGAQPLEEFRKILSRFE